ncbi:MAG: glycosyltransferase, partial [Longimicrobiaceae bacterium]
MSELSLRPKLELAGSTHPRIRAAGKHLYVGQNKFCARGVTYGTFAPDANGDQFPAREVVESDFARISAHGMNSVRTYTVPPRWLLDAALRHDLRVMVGLPWEQHIAFLDERERVRDIERRVREGVRSC